MANLDIRSDLIDVQEKLGVTRLNGGRVPARRLFGARLISDTSAGLTDYETFLGTQVGLLLSFAERDNASRTWADSLTVLTQSLAEMAALGRMPLFAWPGMHGTAGNGYVETLRGDHDATIVQMFTLYAVFMRTYFPSETIWVNRLMWEMNYWKAYPWCRAFLTPRQYKRLWRYICRLAWSVDERFAFIWTPNTRVNGKDGKLVNPFDYDPGPLWAEIVGCDAYLNYADEVLIKGKTPDQVLSDVWDGDYGIRSIYAHAEATGRPFSIDETATNGDSTTGTGNTNGTTGDTLLLHWKWLYEFMRTKNVWGVCVWNKSFQQQSNGQYVKCAQAIKDGWNKVVKPWTPALHFGPDLVEHLDVSVAASVVSSSGLVGTLRDQVANKAYGRYGAAGAVYSATGRNNKPAITFDATGALVLTDVSNIPAFGKAYTTAMQMFVASDAAQFAMALSDSDAAGTITRSRAIGHHSGNLRAQGVDAFVSDAIRNGDGTLDATVVVTTRDAYAPTVNLRSTVQASVNGNPSWTDETAITIPSGVTPTKRVLMGCGGASDAVGNLLKGGFQEIITIKREVTPEERALLEGYLAWKWGNTARLPDNHPYKAAAPTYGGPM